jgi:RimJ/RimL family protein N-acetyltransferase
MSDALMDEIDAAARSMGYKSVRADTHRKNEPMKKLLERHGYRYRGNLVIDSEPGRDPRRQAFEKVLK